MQHRKTNGVKSKEVDEGGGMRILPKDTFQTAARQMPQFLGQS